MTDRRSRPRRPDTRAVAEEMSEGVKRFRRDRVGFGMQGKVWESEDVEVMRKSIDSRQTTDEALVDNVRSGVDTGSPTARDRTP